MSYTVTKAADATPSRQVRRAMGRRAAKNARSEELRTEARIRRETVRTRMRQRRTERFIPPTVVKQPLGEDPRDDKYLHSHARAFRGLRAAIGRAA